MRKVVLASGNQGKLRELQSLLAACDLDLLSQADFDLETPEETGLTFVENALIKARYVADKTGLPAIADDSGLAVRALNGAPGIYSARYAGEGSGGEKNDRANFISYDSSSIDNPPDASVLIIHSNNQTTNDPILLAHYSEGTPIKHRWWFPESYRGLTPAKLLRGLVNRDSWRIAKDYFLHRKIHSSIGSEGAYVYFARGFPSIFEASH